MSAMSVVMIVGIAALFAAILLAFVAVGFFNNDPRGVNKSLAIMQSFSTLPQTAAPRDRRETGSFTERVVAPLLDRSLGFARKFTPTDHTDRMRRRLELAGNPPGWTVDRFTSLKLVGALVSPFIMLIFCVILGFPVATTLVLLVGAGVAGYFGPNMYLYQLAYNRTDRISKAVPDALDLLTISVESGLGFESALAQVARNTEGPLAEELARVLQEMQLGMGRAAALRALAERTDVETLKAFVSALVQAEVLGIPTANVLRVQAREIRLKRRQSAEEAAQKVAVKILIPLIFCILPCLFIVVLGPAAISFMGAF